MKKSILIFGFMGALLSSCMKSETCECRLSDGTLMFTDTYKTNNRSEMRKFEDKCRKMKYQVTTSGVVTEVTPCEIVK